MILRVIRPFAASVLTAMVSTACSNALPIPATRSTAEPAVVYAAIGASETYGTGADDRYRQAWPQLFYNDALPQSAVFYNFGVPGINTAQALKDELPGALRVKANVVTVWLNVNDLVQGVSPSVYAGQLRQLVHGLRRGDAARVLVANVPDLRELPAFKACLPTAAAAGPTCPISPSLVPSADKLLQLINAYNALIAQVVKQEGATLVDLFQNGSAIGQHPDWISSDGFHPSAAGYAAIAKSFEDAYHGSANARPSAR
jgi:lysophospholipase L1-like esterase